MILVTTKQDEVRKRGGVRELPQRSKCRGAGDVHLPKRPWTLT